MKRNFTLLLFFFLTCLIIKVEAQFNNSWINFNNSQPYSIQQYFRISVWKDGIYRLTYSDLANVQFPVNEDPHKYQVFHNGVEQYIFVNGESDGVFDSTDYIEFYGEHNDGKLDAALYPTPADQLNPYFSLFNDTAAYYISVNFNAGAVNKRMIIEQDNNFSSYVANDYLIKENIKDFHDGYLDGDDAGYPVNQFYTKSEGFSKDKGSLSNNQSVISTEPVFTPNVYTGGSVPAIISVPVVNANNDGYYHELKIFMNSVNYIDSANFYGYQFFNFQFSTSPSNLISGTSQPNNITYQLSFMTTGLQNVLSYPFIKIRYPHQPGFNGENNGLQYFILDNAQSQTKARLDISNFNSSDLSQRYIYVFEGDSIRKVTVYGSGNLVQALVPFSGAEKKCLLTMESTTYSATGNLIIDPVSNDPSRYARFINYNYNPQAYDYLIVSHKLLWNEAIAYKNYRDIAFTPLLVDIDELYDQFAFGIKKSPFSIHDFCRYAYSTFNAAPKFLFIIGKGVEPVVSRGYGYNVSLVPTYGYPSSDNLFSVGILASDTVPHPLIATGRLAAQTGADVTAYLDKIMAQETAQAQPMPPDWMKHILHFGGGNDIWEQDQIRIALNKYETIIEDTLFGGTVTTYLKTSSNPIQYLNSVALQARIDSGVTMMTFFGHAAGSTFDIATDAPQNYHNKNRYPLVIANSCLVGDIFSYARQLNEDFVLLPDKGAVGFIALPNQGYLGELDIYTNNLYQHIGIYHYGQSIGECMRGAIDSVLYNYYYALNNPDYRNTPLGMGLHGDPALKINPHLKPEYIVSQPSVFFSETGNQANTNISTEMSTFDVNIIVTNLGKMVSDSVHIELARYFPDKPNVIGYSIDTLIPRIHYKDTIVLTLNMDPGRAAGMNHFDVIVDRINAVPEQYDEFTNNRALYIPLLIQSSDITPVYPFKYAIVPSVTQTLKASTSNPFEPIHTYAFELDTTDAFNSPWKKQTTITQVGGIVKWILPPSTLDSNVTYYWRTARNEIYNDTINYRWNESSFIVKLNKTGWGQQHFFQFKNDKYTNVIYNKPQRKFEFSNIAGQIIAHNTSIPGNQQDITVNGSLITYEACHIFDYQMVVTVLDSVTLEPWSNAQYNFGQQNQWIPDSTGNGGYTTCTNHQHPEDQFMFYTDYINHPEQIDSILSMLSQVPCGDYIIIYNALDAKFNTWDSAKRAQFVALTGMTQADTITGNEAYIFFTQKCNPGSQVFSIATAGQTDITLYAVVGGNWYKGFITSEQIGPAVNWTSLHWGEHPYEITPGADSVYLDLVAIDTLGHQTTIISNLPNTITDFQLNGISATTYPYMYFKAYVEDAVLRTPPQLDRWQIYYDPVPECAVNSNGFTFYKDTLMEGDSVAISIPIENISTADMDSLLVDFYFYDNNRVKHMISSPRYKPLLAGQSLTASTKATTRNYSGNNSLWVEANPHNDQREQYHYNNFANLDYHVNRDITNPILDVTFDGVHILNGDLVSAKPYILMSFKDENKFLEQRDTNKYVVKLKAPSGSLSRLIFESAPNVSTDRTLMKWTPANLPANNFKIEYNPVFPEDGIYELQVQGRDASGNASGVFDYVIQFEVINKSTITNVLNYPNPFTTATRFVFTLTGSEIPSYMKIQIMTVSGKIVREITTGEIGNIHVGRNITEYAWDGKDQFGDQLAKGVYLYRVVSEINGSSIEHRETDADRFFLKGFGKMYLLK